MANLGKTLLIANPSSHSGKAADAAAYTQRFFESYTAATSSFEAKLTKAAAEAEALAKAAAGYNTLLVLGGDGIVHEAINGLMKLERNLRPQLGVIAVGTGNDYARSLGLARNDPARAISQLLKGNSTQVELGLVNGCYFMETLSFGIDAAIALDTSTRRAEGSAVKGSGLYASSAVKLVSRASKGWAYTARFDGESHAHQALMLAVQIGPSYGGGFKICPTAKLNDGYLSLCYNTRIPAMPHAMGLLGLARFGKHSISKILSFQNIRTAVIDFDEAPPCQVDGEELKGSHYEIEVIPEALDVIHASTGAALVPSL